MNKNTITQFDNKIDRLINLLDYININNKHNLYSKDKINKNEFIQNIYHLNKLVIELVDIYTKNISYIDKIKLIQNLKDINGKPFISKKQSIIILNKYAKPLYTLFKNIKKLNKYSIKYNQHNVIGGGGGDINIFNIEKDQLELLFNWIFFPLWSIENTPFIGEFTELYLDIIGLLLNYLDIGLEPIGPLLGVGMSTALDMVQAIPGIGTGASALAIPINIMEEPIEWFISNYGDILDLFLSISRKQWATAYMSALEIIPNLSNIMNSLVENAYVTNKWLSRNNKRIEYYVDILEDINNSIIMFIPMIQSIQKDPTLLVNPTKIFEKLILPNYKKIPGLKKLSPKDIELLQQLINKHSSKLNKLIENPIIYINNPELFYNDIIVPFIKNISDNLDVKQMYVLNQIIKNINTSMLLPP